MLFRNGLREFPALAEYLKTADVKTKLKASPKLWVAIGASIMLPGVLDEFRAQEIVGAAFLLIVLALWIAALSGRRKEPTAREQLRKEAAEVRRSMAVCLEKSRLHRDLGEPTVEVLEACARSWAQIRREFQNSKWTSPELLPHYTELRRQSLEAADLAMDETVLLFRHALPENPYSPDVKAYVGEMIQEAVFGTHKSAGPLPPGLSQARDTAEKLAALAHQVTEVSRQAETELGLPPQLGAGSALDLCIGEMRNIQQAETELRQNLGGK